MTCCLRASCSLMTMEMKYKQASLKACRLKCLASGISWMQQIVISFVQICYKIIWVPPSFLLLHPPPLDHSLPPTSPISPSVAPSCPSPLDISQIWPPPVQWNLRSDYHLTLAACVAGSCHLSGTGIPPSIIQIFWVTMCGSISMESAISSKFVIYHWVTYRFIFKSFHFFFISSPHHGQYSAQRNRSIHFILKRWGHYHPHWVRVSCHPILGLCPESCEHPVSLTIDTKNIASHREKLKILLSQIRIHSVVVTPSSGQCEWAVFTKLWSWPRKVKSWRFC